MDSPERITSEEAQNEAPQAALSPPGPVIGIQRSCVDCSHLRLRCVRDPDGGVGAACYRCIRHNRQCKPREKRTRPGPKPRGLPAHITELEDKIASLTKQLATQQQSLPQLDNLEEDDQESLFPAPNRRNGSPGASRRLSFAPPPPIEPYNDAVLRNLERLKILGQTPPSEINVNFHAAESLLGRFQTVMTGYFPFVVIPAGITAPWLLQAKPFLFRCVIALTSNQTPVQQEVMTLEIMRYLTHHLLFAGAKNLDLLQGVLVYISWYHIHQQSHNNTQITNMLQMAISLLSDLGLNKAPRPTAAQAAADSSYQSRIQSHQDVVGLRTKDERRALLGCFYLSSVMSSSFKKMDAMRYTTHVDESYRVLSGAPEYQSDLYLINLVRLQQFAENVTQTLPYDLPEHAWQSKPPIGMYIKSYEAELKTFKDSVPANLASNSSLQMHLMSNEIHLYEIALCEGAGLASYGTYALGRVDILHAAMLSAKSLVSTFLGHPISEYRNFPFVMWLQTLHALLVLSKLSTVDDAGWDLIYVRSVIHFSEILDQLILKFQQAKDAEDPYLQPTCRWNSYAQRIQRLRDWYESKISVAVPDRDQRGTAASPIPVLDDHPLNQEDPQLANVQHHYGDLTDDAFWRDIMGDWGSL